MRTYILSGPGIKVSNTEADRNEIILYKSIINYCHLAKIIALIIIYTDKINKYSMDVQQIKLHLPSYFADLLHVQGIHQPSFPYKK